MAAQCGECREVFENKIAMCSKCGSIEINEVSDEALADQREAEADFQKFLERARNIECYTTESPAGVPFSESLGMVFGNSSKQAFWGLSTQANRLSRAYEAALINLKFDAAKLGADAVVGIRFALNNSTGSNNQILAGSSEAVMLLGTAVKK